MAFSWHILIFVYVVNSAWIGAMYLAQYLDKRIPKRGSIISGTNQTYIHMQDWHTILWGDTIALPLVMNAFAQVAINGSVSVRQWVFLIIASNSICTIFFQFAILRPTHRPTYVVYDIGKVSWPGLVHMPYFSIYLAISMLVVWNTITGNVQGMTMYLGGIGGVVYSASWIIDTIRGNFAPLQRTSPV